MDGITFYLEANKRNVFAAFTANGTHVSRGVKMQEGIGAVYAWANSAVASTSASTSWLKSCKKIGEAEARKIHPNLFPMLDRSQ